MSVGLASRFGAAGPFVISALAIVAVGPLTKRALRGRIEPFFAGKLGKAGAVPRALTPSAISDYAEWILDCFQATTLCLIPVSALGFALSVSASSSYIGWVYGGGFLLGVIVLLYVFSIEDPYKYVREKRFGQRYSNIDCIAVGVNVVAAILAAVLI